MKKRKKIKKYKNKKIKISTEKIENNIININPQNYSFLSIDVTRNKREQLSPSKSEILINRESTVINDSIYRKEKIIKSNDINNIMSSPRSNSKKNIMINKSSETKQKIKVVPLGKKIKPLVITKIVEKPKIGKILNKDGSFTDVIKQNSVITSIESKPIMNKEKESIVKESVTKVYTTLTKDLDEINDINNIYNNFNANNNIDYNTIDNINIVEKKNNDKNIEFNKYNKQINNYKDNGRDYMFIKRDFNYKKENECKLQKIDKSNNFNNIGKNYSFNNNNQYENNYFINNNMNNNMNNNINNNIYNNIDNNINNNIINDIFEITDNSTIPKNSDYSSIGFNSINFIENKPNLKKDQINYIKSLYYINLNKLRIYFLNLNDEEKNNILANLNDGNIENKKIYNKLLDILKEKM